MEVTLEKIELVKDRTGVSYKEAKEALEQADGSVVDAIINIEEDLDAKGSKSIGEQSGAVVECVKDMVNKGNVSRIVVRKKDGETILNLPVTAGVVATILAPGGVLVSVLAAFGFKCTVEVVKTDGTIIDVSDRANDAFDKAREKGSDLFETAKDKAGDVKEKVQNSDKFDMVKDKAEDVMEKVQSSEAFEKVMDKAEDVKEMVSDKTGLFKSEAEEEMEAEEMAEEFAKDFEEMEEVESEHEE